MGPVTKRKILIDCDPGTDDAQAILMALSCHGVEVAAITTVFGNSEVENTSRNALLVLQQCDRLDIPVYKGCGQSLDGHPSLTDRYHGLDGLGDLPDLVLTSDAKIQQEHAVNAIINLVDMYPGEISLVALGPLTNIATVLKRDPDFGSKLRDCMIMGGNHRGKSNIQVSKYAEFNFYSDPEAADIVLKRLHDVDITLVDMDVCEDTFLSRRWYADVLACDTKTAQFLKSIQVKMVDIADRDGFTTFPVFDQLAVAVALDDTITTETKVVSATVVLEDSPNRGQMIVNWNGALEAQSYIKLVLKVNAEKLQDFIKASILKT